MFRIIIHSTPTNLLKAGTGNIIGCDFAHLGDIIKEVNDKTRVGVCLDTCGSLCGRQGFQQLTTFLTRSYVLGSMSNTLLAVFC